MIRYVGAVGVFAAVGQGLVAVDAFQRPGAAARHAQEAREGGDQFQLVQAFQHGAGADLGAAGDEIEDRASANVDPAGDPEVGQRVDVRPAEQGGNHAFVGQADGQRVRGQVRGDGGAVPQGEAKIEAQPLARMGQQSAQAFQPGGGGQGGSPIVQCGDVRSSTQGVRAETRSGCRVRSPCATSARRTASSGRRRYARGEPP